MSRTFGMLADAATGFTAVGVLRDYKCTASAEARYGLDANGEPAASAFVKQPKTISAELEVTGTVPDAAATITIGGTAFKTTKVEQTWNGDGSVSTVSIEASISL